MFIYADETGNSGRNIFDKQEVYCLGAIFSVTDIEAAIGSIIRPFLGRHGLDRAHAHKLEESLVAELGMAIIDTLNGAGEWSLHLTNIHKPYLATTKFVDTIFDSGENVAVPWHWYNLQLFRHVLCCAIDELLTPLNRQRFWEAYLADDMALIQVCIRNAGTYLTRRIGDSRLRQVIREAFDFALRHPEQFTLSASKGRRGYQGHTPNMVAFSSLLGQIHKFAAATDSKPIAFYHDRQQEFGRSMQELHELFGPIEHIEDRRGGWPEIRRVGYELAKFSMPSSKDMAALQAVDVLLWLIQRERRLTTAKTTLDMLRPKASDFYISRWMSELIVRSRLKQVYSEDLSDEQLANAKVMLSGWDSARLKRVAEIEKEKQQIETDS